MLSRYWQALPSNDQHPSAGTTNGVEERKELTLTLGSQHGAHHHSRRRSVLDSTIDCVPTSFVVDGDRIVGGSAAGKVIEWLIPAQLLPHLTAATYTNPFASVDGQSSSPSLTITPSFPTSSISFQLAVHSSDSLLLLPVHRSSIASAFHSPSVSQRLSLTSGDTDPCTCSVVLTEGSGRAVLLARGFTSGLIRVYGPGSRSPASPGPATPRSSLSSSSYLPSLSSSSSFSSSQLLPNMPPTPLVLDFRAHVGAHHRAAVHRRPRVQLQPLHDVPAARADMTVGIWDVSRATLLKRIRLTSVRHLPAQAGADRRRLLLLRSVKGRGGQGRRRRRYERPQQG